MTMKASASFTAKLASGFKQLVEKLGIERVQDSPRWSLFWAVSDSHPQSDTEWHQERRALRDAHIETAIKKALADAGITLTGNYK